MKEKKNRMEIALDAISYVWKITVVLHRRYYLYTLMILAIQMMSISQSFLVGRGVDIIVGSSDFMSLGGITVLIAVISVLICLGHIIESVFHINNIAFDVEGHLRLYSFGKLFKLSPGQITRENTGLKMDTLQKGSSAVTDLMSLIFEHVIPTVIRILISISLLFYVNWIVAICILSASICFAVASIVTNNYYVDRVKEARKLESDTETKFWEIVKNLKLVISMAAHEKTLRSFLQRQDTAFREGKKVWCAYNIAVGLLRNMPFQYFLYAPILLLIFTLVKGGSISTGDIAIIISLIGGVYMCLSNIGTIQRQIMRSSINVVRLRDFIEQEPECADHDDAIQLENPRGDIVFDHVSFAYEAGKPHALNNVSFHIKPGETVAFVGPSGSGKSTIVSLILRANAPQSGTIRVDDLPIETIAINSWRRRIGTVSQQTMLWDASVRENILFGSDRDLAPGDLDAVVRYSRIEEFLARLGKDGLGTLIGENGAQLSGGQCQRIAIARVLAGDPSVIVFDEATSALDYKTEAEVYVAMENALRGRTGIIIAHRLGTVKKANRIIVLDKGQVVGEGTYDELSATNEFFKTLIGSEIK